MRNALAEQCQAGNDECGVGGHHDAPAVLTGLRPLQCQVDGGGRDHAAQCRSNRQGRHAWVAHLAQDGFTLEFECHQEEEQRHQPVVDPAFQRTTEFEFSEPQFDPRFPDAEESICPWGIGQKEGGDGEHQQDGATGRLDVQEPDKGRGDPVDQCPRELNRRCRIGLRIVHRFS
ncbi:hypothetical protein D9M69_488630 [compost metagenome]